MLLVATAAGGRAAGRGTAFPPDPRGQGGFTALEDLRAFADAAAVARSRGDWRLLHSSLVATTSAGCTPEGFQAWAEHEHRGAREAAERVLLSGSPMRSRFVAPPRMEWRTTGVSLTAGGGEVTRSLWAEGRPVGAVTDATERWVQAEGAWWLVLGDGGRACATAGEAAETGNDPNSAFRRPMLPDAPVEIGTLAGSALLTLVDARRGSGVEMPGAPLPEGFEYVFVELEARAAGEGVVHVPTRFAAGSFDGLLYAGPTRWEVRGCTGDDRLDPGCQRLRGIVAIAADDPGPRLGWSSAPAHEQFVADVWWWLPGHGDERTLSQGEAAAATAAAGLSLDGWGETDLRRQTPGFEDIVDTGLGRNSVTALNAPRYETVREADRWLALNEPVQVVERDGQARAYPLRILIWHEIVNDTLGGTSLLVTYCPLCNTALAFERGVGVRDVAFRTSGLLRSSNLVMYDDWTESWWQQATGEAIAGELAGARLTPVPSLLIAWRDFRDAYPEGDVLSIETGLDRDYDFNPYLNYDLAGEVGYLRGEPDARLPVMARVLGVEAGGEAVAFRFASLAATPVVNTEIGGQPVAVFYQRGTTSALQSFRVDLGRDVGSAVAFDPRVGGQRLTFLQTDAGLWRDAETGSIWSFLGEAVEGPLKGAVLDRLVQDNGFWFSWAAFHPGTGIHELGGG